MNHTEVVFENIEQRLLKEIEEAHYAIFVSVAWFTNKRLFKALLEKAKDNCYVSIIIQLDDINSQSGINYDEIKIGRSECFFISKDAELLHDKFCVIDFKKVITGSYNWTYKASQNSENVIILSEPTVATQYTTRFEQQKAKYAEQSTKETASQTTPKPSVSAVPLTITPPIKITPKPVVAPTRILKCSHCEREVKQTDTYCWFCGSHLKDSKQNLPRHRTCSKCGHTQSEPILARETSFCTKCGHKYGWENSSAYPVCTQCGTTWRDGYYCTTCGLRHEVTGFGTLTARREYREFKDFQCCSHCHAPNYFGDTFCHKCGKDLTSCAEDSRRHGWVDLGLSVLWSTETMPGYYPWMNSKPTTLTRRGVWGDYERDGKDPATEKWGAKWRMPTKEELEELIFKCIWEKIVLPDSKKNALKITGPNGNHMILPVTGRRAKIAREECLYFECFLWTSTQKDEYLAYCLKYIGYSPDWIEEWKGFTNRQILEKLLEYYKEPPSSIYQNYKEYFKRIPEQAMIDEEDRIFYQQESILKEKLNSSNDKVQEQQDSKSRIEYMRNELWLGKPFVKWPLIMSDSNDIGMTTFIDESALAIRPVADKKWQGKL